MNAFDIFYKPAEIIELAAAAYKIKFFIFFKVIDNGTPLPIRTISPDDLPDDWQMIPAPRTLLTIGGDWVRTNREVGLRVPSAVIPQEWNMLLNPAHRDFPAIKWTNEGPFHWDARLERNPKR